MRVPSKIAAVSVLLLLAVAVWWVPRVHLDPSGSALMQYFSLALLSVAACATLRQWAAGSYSTVMGVCVSLFTLMWGRVIFCGYLYYDEVHRAISIPPVNKWLVTPVNDHLTPLMYLVWTIQYRFFNGEYWCIALSHYCFGLLAVCGLVRIVQAGIPRNSAFHTLGILFVALSTLSPRIWIWKGCGDSPVIALALFVWLYYHCIRSEGTPSHRHFAGLVVLYILLLASCSAITLGFVFLLPLLLVPQYRTRRFAALLAAFFTLSGVYWLLRLQLISEMRPHRLQDIPGAFAKVWYTYSGSWEAGILLALIALSGPLLFIRQRRVTVSFAVWTAGLFMYALGTLQLWGARDLVWSLSRELTGYHMLLPYTGISLLVGTSIACWSNNWKVVAFTLSFASGGFYLLTTAQLAENIVPDHQAVIAARAEFFGDLDRAAQSGKIPDRSVGKMSYFWLKKLDWTEIKLFTDPEMVSKFRTPDNFNLKTLCYIFGRRQYTLLPADTPEVLLDPAVGAFVQKYWAHTHRAL